MKKALISPNELVGLGCRVVEVCDADFEVASPLFWVDCPDDLDITKVYYNIDLANFQDIIKITQITIPQIVTMRQARLALLQSGYLDIVNTAIANMTGVEGAAAKIEWEYAQTVDIKSPLVTTMTTMLSLTEEQLDDLFTLAGGL